MKINLNKTRVIIAEIQADLNKIQRVLKEAIKGKIEVGEEFSGLDDSTFNYSDAQKQLLKDKYVLLKNRAKILFQTLP